MSNLSAKILVWTTVLGFVFSTPYALAARFIDLSGNWAEKYVNTLSDRGIIPPETDGKFKPNDPVTRAQLASWLVKVLGLENQPVPGTPSFPDVKKTDWFYAPVEIIRQNNYISGYADGFRPHQFIQKAEVIQIVVRTLGGPSPDESVVSEELARYKDGGKVPDWARASVAQASRAKILVNYPDPLLVNSSQLATRADAAALLNTLQEYFMRQSIAEKVSEASSGVSTNATSPGAPVATELPNYGSTVIPESFGQSPQSETPSTSYAQQQPVYQGQVERQLAAPGAYLQGNVTVLDAGTHFRAVLNNTLNSSYNQVGEEFLATIIEPVTLGGVEVIPVGSKLVGQITHVVSAKNFHFSTNGSIDVKFIAVQTPDGRKFPLVARVDVKQMRAAGGVNSGPVGTTVKKTSQGAVKGAKWGGIAGGIYGATTGSARKTLQSAGVGAIAGSIVGAGAGLVGAGVQKGQDVNVPAGTSIPVQLDEPLQLTGASAPTQSTGGGFAPFAPVNQPPYGFVPAAQPLYGQPVQPPQGYPH
ncbi:MAG: S-layer homology domain-containing protein [Candidatus Melainabacteria bacterium]|nr:S-layer homology domain-containing protein [Candidatus Melainabacteria bacterium]